MSRPDNVLWTFGGGGFKPVDDVILIWGPVFEFGNSKAKKNNNYVLICSVMFK